MNKTERLYIAYGSNLNLEQMQHRCPSAEAIGLSALEDYRLLFRGSTHGAVATVEPFSGGSVPALVWRLQPRDEAALDAYEGYPNLYRKEMVSVELDGEAVEAMIYIMNDGWPLGQPGCSYYATIREGYVGAGFDLDVLRQAASDSVS